ncbi:MAG: MYG1 family protein [Myxococcales bacterium]|nr:MYG1 family protein [Myxococcales bacterium]
MRIGTHSGSFHADDVLAVALLRAFVDADASVVRTRDEATLAEQDVVVDVGGRFDPEARRFDHHQNAYEGARSSAGMVLDWLEHEGAVSPALATRYREVLVDYVDDVDNGRRPPEPDVPCFSSIVATLADSASDETFDALFEQAAGFAKVYVEAVAAGHARERAAVDAVRDAMQAAIRRGDAVVYLDRYLKWKPAYFELGGATHPTDYVVFPTEQDVRVVAIPPELGSFEKKRALPEPWGGLRDDALSEVVGVPGARFCHKNRFLAVFDTLDHAVAALERWGLSHRPRGCGGGRG